MLGPLNWRKMFPGPSEQDIGEGIKKAWVDDAAQ